MRPCVSRRDGDRVFLQSREKPMHAAEIAALAATLRAHPERAARVADNLDTIAGELAQREALPVPAELRAAARH